MNLVDKIKLLAIDLADGETRRVECPACGSVDSFCVTLAGNEIKYIDFSASCGISGVISSHGFRGKPAKPKPLPELPGLYPLDAEQHQYLTKKFNVALPYLWHIRYSHADGRVYIPLYDGAGGIAAYIARYYVDLANGPQIGSKALFKPVTSTCEQLLWSMPEVMLSARECKRVLLVEDPMSALRVWAQCGVPVAPLLGTFMKEYQLNTILEMGINKVYVALDSDATIKAVDMKRRINVLVDTSVIPLTGKDIKDLSIEALDNLLIEYNL
jgi:hypothetical protein